MDKNQKHSESTVRSCVPRLTAVKRCAGDLSMRHHDETPSIHTDTNHQTKLGEIETVSPQ